MSIRHQEEVVYEVVGTISERRETATTSGAGVEVLTAIAISLVLLPFTMSVTHLFNGHAPIPARSSHVTSNVSSELTQNAPAPPSHPWSAPFALPTHPETSGEIKGNVTYERTLPTSNPLSIANYPTSA